MGLIHLTPPPPRAGTPRGGGQSATGVWLADPSTTLALGAVVAVVFYALALYAAKSAMWRYRAMGIWGVE